MGESMGPIGRGIALTCLCFAWDGAVFAQATPREPASDRERAERIATEPARDIGLQRVTIPPVLEAAGSDPYSLAGTRTCAGMSAELRDLDRALGADFDAPPTRRGNRAGRLAEAGGRAVVNTIIPFRGVVRELSGSAEADRRLQAAVDAGLARRGFLRGLAQSRGCRR